MSRAKVPGEIIYVGGIPVYIPLRERLDENDDGEEKKENRPLRLKHPRGNADSHSVVGCVWPMLA